MATSDFLPLMPDTINLAAFTGRDSYGKPTYSSDVPYSARVTYKNFNVRKSDNSEVVAKGIVWVGGTPDTAPEDRLTLPGGDTPPILVAEKYNDDVGTHHVKIIFGK